MRSGLIDMFLNRFIRSCSYTTVFSYFFADKTVLKVLVPCAFVTSSGKVCEREVVGSIPGRAIPKTLKLAF